MANLPRSSGLMHRYRQVRVSALFGLLAVASCQAFSSPDVSPTGDDAGANDAAVDSGKTAPDASTAADAARPKQLVGTESICPPPLGPNGCAGEQFTGLAAEVTAQFGLWSGALEPVALTATKGSVVAAMGYDGYPSASGAVARWDATRDWPVREVHTVMHPAARSLSLQQDTVLVATHEWGTGQVGILSERTELDAGTTKDASDGGTQIEIRPIPIKGQLIREVQWLNANRYLVSFGYRYRSAGARASGGSVDKLTYFDTTDMRSYDLKLSRDGFLTRKVLGYRAANVENIYLGHDGGLERVLNSTDEGAGRKLLFKAPLNFTVSTMVIRDQTLYFVVRKANDDCDPSAFIIRMALDDNGLPLKEAPPASLDAGSDANVYIDAGADGGAIWSYSKFAEGLRCPESIAVDSSYVYWAESVPATLGPNGGTIQRKSTIVSDSVVAGIDNLQANLDHPENLTATASGLYWIEYVPAMYRRVVRRIRSSKP
jgi:hypothetical protein